MENPLIYSIKENVKYTKERLLRNISIFKVLKTGKLENSIRTEFKATDTEIEVSFFFKTYGRFVDMGAQMRKAKKWYSKLIYGRLAQMRKIAVAKMKEKSLNIFR